MTKSVSTDENLNASVCWCEEDHHLKLLILLGKEDFWIKVGQQIEQKVIRVQLNIRRTWAVVLTT